MYITFIEVSIQDSSLPPLDETKQYYLEWFDNSPLLYFYNLVFKLDMTIFKYTN